VCERACESGDRDACPRAVLAMRARPLETDAKRFAAVLGRACDGGDVDACKALAEVVLYAPSLPRDEARSKALYARACELGDGIGCLESAGGDDAATRHARAVIGAKCDAGDGASCDVMSGLALALDHDPAKSASFAARAATDLESSCLRGAADDCEKGARVIDASPGKQASRVYRLLDRGCALGAMPTCTLLATSSDDMRAEDKRALLRKACDGAREDACLILGKFVRDGDDGLAADPAAAKPLLDRGLALAAARCELADTLACDTLASALVLDAMPIADAKKSVDRLEAVCDRRAAVTCGRLAEALEAGPAALRDAGRIARIKEKGCAFGYPFACPDPKAALGVGPR